MIFKRKRRYRDGRVAEFPHWYYKFVRNGVLIEVNTKQGNKTVAKELEAAHRTRLAKGEADLEVGAAPTFKELSKRFLESVKGRNPVTEKFYRSKVVPLLDYSPIANRRINQIDERLIERWVAHRLSSIIRRGPLRSSNLAHLRC